MSFLDGAEPVRRGPTNSLEFRRIEALPRRRWEDAEDLEDLITGLTELIKTPQGSMELFGLQASAIREIHDQGGMFGPIGVGEGKALVTLLAPLVCKVKRPLLLVPAQLRDQTVRKVIPEMSKHFQMHENLRVVGYSELGLLKNEKLIEEFDPDMILSDECHFLKNPKAGCTKRVDRHMTAKPETIFVALSGTAAKHSIMDYWQIVKWCLGEENMPLPNGFYEVQQWADALDARVKKQAKRKPGAIVKFCKAGENPRQGYRRRLTETPGVIATAESELGVSLRVSGRKAKMPKDLSDVIEKMRRDWVTPSGEIIMEAAELWRHTRSLVCGFYYKWDPAPPKAWLRARKEWGQYVTHRLRHNRLGLDTELQVWNECESGERKAPEWFVWSDWKAKFKENSVPVWLDDYLVRACSEWLDKNEGICWVEQIAFGQALAKHSGYKYFGAGANEIVDATGPIIASIAAHGTGKNLQHYNKALVSCPPPSGDTWEQLLGREHRNGQLADLVHYEVFQHSPHFVEAMRKAVIDATFLADGLTKTQRLLYCDRMIP